MSIASSNISWSDFVDQFPDKAQEITDELAGDYFFDLLATDTNRTSDVRCKELLMDVQEKALAKAQRMIERGDGR